MSDAKAALFIFIFLIIVGATITIPFLLFESPEGQALGIFTGLMLGGVFCLFTAGEREDEHPEEPQRKTSIRNKETRPPDEPEREKRSRRSSNAIIDPLGLGDDPMHKDDLIPPFF